MRLLRPALMVFLWPAAVLLGADVVSREIRIAVVDTGVKAIWRNELNETFQETLTQVIERAAARTVVVRAEMVAAEVALDRLRSGACDAVVLIGPERPRAFRRTNDPMLATSFGAARNFEPVYLLFGQTDPGSRQRLRESFPLAVAAASGSPSNARLAIAPLARGSAADRVATSETQASRSPD